MISMMISIALLGLLVWAVITYIPMPIQFKQAILILATIFLIIFIANGLGLVHELPAHLR